MDKNMVRGTSEIFVAVTEDRDDGGKGVPSILPKIRKCTQRPALHFIALRLVHQDRREAFGSGITGILFGCDEWSCIL